MIKEEIRKSLLKDSYIDFAYSRYLKFKETPAYDEDFKIETLEKLNEYFQAISITEESVLDVAIHLQKSNPSTGSFVHWSNLADLVKYVEERPAEVAELWNHLYDENISIEERILDFRQKGISFNKDISLGAPLFGYLLAAYNHTKYPLYKGSIYTDVKASYLIDQKMGAVSENYSVYLVICQNMLDYFQTSNPDIAMLDVQDFLYCSSHYNKIKVESAVDYLSDLATTLEGYKLDPAKMLKAVIALDKEVLYEIREIYRGTEKINKIKFRLVNQILEEGNATIKDLEKIKHEVSNLYDTKILQAYNNFSIMFQLFYYNKKYKVNLELGKIHQVIRQFKALEDFDFTKDKTLNGFNYNNNFGGSSCWLAIYETKYLSHREAAQFFVHFNKEDVSLGLVYGDRHESRGIEEVEVLKDVNEFTYEALEEKMSEVAEIIKKIDVDDTEIDPYYSKDLIDNNIWRKLFLNQVVFREDDLVMLKKMYDFGGKATATELAAALGSNHSAIVLNETNVNKLKGQVKQLQDEVYQL